MLLPDEDTIYFRCCRRDFVRFSVGFRRASLGILAVRGRICRYDGLSSRQLAGQEEPVHDAGCSVATNMAPSRGKTPFMAPGLYAISRVHGICDMKLSWRNSRTCPTAKPAKACASKACLTLRQVAMSRKGESPPDFLGDAEH